jgi:hypothetical protein
MRFELPGTKNRREILAEPELLRINAEGVGKRAKFLFGALLTLLYATFMIGTFRIISSKSEMTSFFIFALIFTVIYLPTMKQILNKKIVSLVFTRIGIADTGLFAVKYDKLGGYRWEKSSGVIATGQASKNDEITLFLSANSGLFPEAAFVTRFGGSVLASYGYFFNADQIKCAEEILNSFGINKLPDRT